MQRLQEKPFVLGFYACFQNAHIIWVYVVASGFGMLFYRGADIPISSRFVLSCNLLSTFLGRRSQKTAENLVFFTFFRSVLTPF